MRSLSKWSSYETTTKSTGSSATVTLKTADGVHSATASGNGPVNALDLALRQCLSKLYPSIASVRLTDYKVRVLDFKKGTAARVRVLVEWTDHKQELGHGRRLRERHRGKLVRTRRRSAP